MPARPDRGHRRPPGAAAAGVRRVRGRRADRRGRQGRRDLAARADAGRPSRSCARARPRRRGRASRTRPTGRRGACSPARARDRRADRGPARDRAAGAGRRRSRCSQQLFDEEQGEEAVRWLPHTVTAVVLGAAALLVLAWLLSTLGAVVAFGGFTLTRDGDRLRIRRGLVAAQRGDRAGRAGARRAGRRGRLPAPVRARGADRRGHGLRRGGRRGAHAVPARARARRRGASWTSSCPSWPTTRAGWSARRARAARRYYLLPAAGRRGRSRVGRVVRSSARSRSSRWCSRRSTAARAGAPRAGA